MGNETNNITEKYFNELNEKKEKIILNIDNNILEEENNIEINNNTNINDIKTKQDNNINTDEFDDFDNSTFMKEQKNSNNIEKIYMWIDPDINNKQNKMNYNYLINTLQINIKTFRNIDECFNHINDNYNKFKEIIIIFSLIYALISIYIP